MKPRDTSGSWRHFPPDLLLASGVPIVFVAIFSSWLLSLHGNEWIIAFCVAVSVSLAGAALIFCAKLPLYRKGIFWTVGSSDLPQSSQSLYRWGIRLSVLGCILTALLVVGSFIWR